MLINEKHIMLKARVEVWFQTKLDNDRIVVTVDMSVDAVEAFEDLPDQGRESFREGNAWYGIVSTCTHEQVRSRYERMVPNQSG